MASLLHKGRVALRPFQSWSRALYPCQRAFHLLPWRKEEKSKSELPTLERFWKDMGDRLKDLDDNMRAMTRSLGDGRSSGGNLASLGDFWPFSADLFRSLFMVPEIVEEGGRKLYKVEIPVGKQFVADNVKIVMKNYDLTVDAVLKDKSPDGRQQFFTEVKRQITLPDCLDLEKMKSVMGDDGVLRVEAPIKEGAEAPSSCKEIPIERIK